LPTIEAAPDHIHLLIPELSDLLVGSQGRDHHATASLPGSMRWQPSAAPAAADAVLDSSAPLAAFAWYHDARTDVGGKSAALINDCFVRADPVHMQADMSRVHLLQVEHFNLQPDQADAMIDSLQPLFQEHAMRLERGSNDRSCERWYVRSAEALPASWAAPWQALGQALETALQTPSAGRFWLRLQAEAQMLMHDHPVNQQRQRQGLPALNSLWFWGSGRLPNATATATATASAADRPGWSAALLQSPQLAGYCDWLQVPQVQLDSPGSVVSALPHGGSLLLEWRLDRRRSQAGNWQALVALLQLLLADGKRRQLTVQCVAGRCLRMTCAPAWRRWLGSVRSRLPMAANTSAWHQQQLRWLAGMDAVT